MSSFRHAYRVDWFRRRQRQKRGDTEDPTALGVGYAQTGRAVDFRVGHRRGCDFGDVYIATGPLTRTTGDEFVWPKDSDVTPFYV